MEIMDKVLLEATNNFSKAGYPLEAEAMLIVELDGTKSEVEELIKKVAQSKYLLLDYEGALKLFEQGRDISKNDFELLQGEANTRLILEKEKISDKTLFLFKEILYRDPNDLTAIMVIAEQSYKKNNYKEAKIYYEKLLSLIDKNSLEYNEIYKRYNSIEKND